MKQPRILSLLLLILLGLGIALPWGDSRAGDLNHFFSSPGSQPGTSGLTSLQAFLVTAGVLICIAGIAGKAARNARNTSRSERPGPGDRPRP